MKINIILAIVILGSAVFFSGFTEDYKRFNYSVYPHSSIIVWKAASKKAERTGSFSIISDGIEVENGVLKKGSFTIPIASINNFDLSAVLKKAFLKHLKSADFFNIAVFPEAKFNITEVTPGTNFSDSTLAGVNHSITGDFTMLGETHEITFPAKVAFEDNTLYAEAILTIDRTKWGMTYGTDSSSGNHSISPLVDIHLKLLAKQK